MTRIAGKEARIPFDVARMSDKSARSRGDGSEPTVIPELALFLGVRGAHTGSQPTREEAVKKVAAAEDPRPSTSYELPQVEHGALLVSSLDERDREADESDREADRRDADAHERVREADARDREEEAAERHLADGIIDLCERRERIRLRRKAAAAERCQAALDRTRAAGDRRRAALDRQMAARERAGSQAQREILSRGSQASDEGTVSADETTAVAAHGLLSSSAVVTMAIMTLLAHWDEMRAGERIHLLQGMLKHSSSIDDRLKALTQGF